MYLEKEKKSPKRIAFYKLHNGQDDEVEQGLSPVVFVKLLNSIYHLYRFNNGSISMQI